MTSAQPSRYFSLAEIQSATKNFNKQLIIGKGGFGTVYKGQISTQVVAIKRLDSTSNQGESEFRIEIDVLLKLCHCNLVSLVGYCDEHNEKILVYPYMPNGNLDHRLHDKGGDSPLSWVKRLKIALGAARGLDHLHTGAGTHHAVIHRDVKSSNILLDENMSAVVSDFGLSKIGPTNQPVSCVNASVKGTFGYLAPEVYNTGKLTRKTDVYAFGVVLLELLTGRRAQGEQNKEDENGLVSWAEDRIKNKRFDQMVDPKIKGTFSISRFAKELATIAYRCVQSDPKDRPPMTEVVFSLQDLLEKSNHASGSSSGVSWKFSFRSFAPMTTRNSDQSGSSSKMKLHHEDNLVIKDVKMFTYDDLKLATRGFGNETCLGEGRYGKVYKGWVDKTTYSPCNDDTDGLPIAVKKLHRYIHSTLGILKEFHHPNLVKLIGACFEGGSLFLVYEFMHKGNFEDLLRNGAVARLPLLTKVKIAIGIARAIVYMQKPQLDPTLCDSKLKRHTILIDEVFTPKLSDYDVTFIVNGKYDKASPDFHGLELVLKTDLSGYEVIFEEVITGVRLDNSNIVKIDRFFRRHGKQSLRHIAQLCFAICNEVDSENKMITMLEQHDKLIRKKLKIWLSDPKN